MNSLPLCTVDPIHYRMNNNNSTKPSAQKSKKTSDATEVARLKKELSRVKRDIKAGSANPQAVERRRQARERTAMAHDAQIDLLKLNHDARSLLSIRNPRLRLHAHYVAWARQQGNASKHSGVHPLYTDNMCQSVQVTAGRTVRLATVTVAAGQCRQISLMARGPSNESNSVNDTYGGTYALMTGLQDAVAYHTRPLCYRNSLGNSDDRVIFPIGAYTVKNLGGVVTEQLSYGCMGLISESGTGVGLASGQCITNLASAASSVRWSPLSPTTSIPYEANRPGHVRAIMTGMHIKIINITAQGSRAGDIVTVSLPHAFPIGGVTSQDSFSKFKTYKLHPIDSPLEFSVPTRPIDMVYQHPMTNVGAAGATGTGTLVQWREAVYAADISSAVAHVWLNNPSAVDQSYTYELTCTWSIAGDLVAGISEMAPLNAAGKNVIVDAHVAQSQAPLTTPSQVTNSFLKAASETADAAFATFKNGATAGLKALNPKNVFAMAGPVL